MKKKYSSPLGEAHWRGFYERGLALYYKKGLTKGDYWEGITPWGLLLYRRERGQPFLVKKIRCTQSSRRVLCVLTQSDTQRAPQSEALGDDCVQRVRRQWMLRMVEDHTVWKNGNFHVEKRSKGWKNDMEYGEKLPGTNTPINQIFILFSISKPLVKFSQIAKRKGLSFRIVPSLFSNEVL